MLSNWGGVLGMDGIITSHRAARFLEFILDKFSVSAIRNRRRSEDCRRKYVVCFGDTVQKVAARELGDVRFAGLVVSINRIAVKLDQHSRVAIIPGTVLELPGEEEICAYKQQFLSRNKVGPASPRMTVNREFLTHLQDTKIDTTVTEQAVDQSITQLPGGLRIVQGSNGAIGANFTVRLQAPFFASFVTIAAYESSLGRTRRIMFNPDGSSAQLNIDLPIEIVEPMAHSDFQRNWQTYYDAYFLPKLDDARQCLLPM
jgi:hypothetical protein